MAITSGIFNAESVECSVYIASPAAVPTSTATNAGYDTVLKDTHNGFTTGASSKYTIPISGNYFATAANVWPNQVNNIRAIYIKVNGTNKATIVNQTASVFEVSTHISKLLVDLVAGDEVAVDIYQNSGGNLTPSGGETQCFFTIHKV